MTTKYISKIKSKEKEVDKYLRIISGEIGSSTGDMIARLTGQVGYLELTTQNLSAFMLRTKGFQENVALELSSLHSTLMALNEPLSRTATQLSALEDNLKEEQRLKIFEWLSTVQYMSHHRTKSKALLPGSGQWLLQKPRFVQWLESSCSSILWLHGIPGSGKSMLVAHVINYLRDRSKSNSSPAPVAYFYCARSPNEPERSDPAEVLRSILEQLSSSDEDTPIREPVVQAYLSRKKEARGRKLEKLGLDEIVQIILQLLESNPATIIIDGLDECDPSRRQDLLNALRTIIAESDNVVKVFVSSRDDHDLVHRLAHTPNLYIHAIDNKDDIHNFVVTRVQEAISEEKLICGKVSQQLRDIIIRTLMRKAEGMFRLVSLHIERLCDPQHIKTETNVLNALEDLPRDLRGSYDVIMSQVMISEQPNPQLAQRVLKWLLCSQERFHSQGLIDAVCLNFPKKISLDLHGLLSICCNLVVYDDEADTFRFAHLSVQEYLESLEEYTLEDNNSFAAEQCLSFIWEPNKNGLSESEISMKTALERAKRKAKFRSFPAHADIYWPKYCHLAGRLREKGKLQLVLQQFLVPESSQLSPQFIEWNHRPRPSKGIHFVGEELRAHSFGDPPNPIFVACASNFFELVPDILRIQGVSTTFLQKNVRGLNCAEIAAQCNNGPTIQALLEVARNLQPFPALYWNDVLDHAIAKCSLEALEAILDEDFIVNDCLGEKAIKRIVRLAPPNRRNPLLLKKILAKSKIPLTNGILEAAMENRYDANMVDELLKLAECVEITISLVTAAFDFTNLRSPMESLLLSKNTIIRDPHVAMIIRQRQDPILDELLLRREEKVLFNREAFETVILNFDEQMLKRLSLSRSSSNFDVRDYLLGNYSSVMSLESDTPLYNALVRRGTDTDEMELTWEDLITAHKVDAGRDFMSEVLRFRWLKIADSAINLIISLWDVDIVKLLLEGRRIEITADVIKAAAGNFQHGRKIMELLLEREQEDLGLE